MAGGATGIVAEPKKKEPRVLVTLHGVVILCLFALLMLTGDAADNVSRTPQLRTEYYVPYLREVAITLPIFVFIFPIFFYPHFPRLEMFIDLFGVHVVLTVLFTDNSRLDPFWRNNLESTISPPSKATKPKEANEVVCNCGCRAAHHCRPTHRIDGAPGYVSPSPTRAM